MMMVIWNMNRWALHKECRNVKRKEMQVGGWVKDEKVPTSTWITFSVQLLKSSVCGQFVNTFLPVSVISLLQFCLKRN